MSSLIEMISSAIIGIEQPTFSALAFRWLNEVYSVDSVKSFRPFGLGVLSTFTGMVLPTFLGQLGPHLSALTCLP